jgi:uncharacterized membrane protein required for colicin V production
MMSLAFVFWMYVVLFAIIGGMRGWAKEILVAFSVILALTFSTLLSNYVPFIHEMQASQKVMYFWLVTIILCLLVFFGYQTPSIARFAAKMTREKLQDVILGAVIGALNGYLIAGTIWHYMADAGYPFDNVIQAPSGGFEIMAKGMLDYMAPHLLGIPGIYFAVVIAFIFVIVVFV